MNGRILWWQTFLAHMTRVRQATRRWWREVTHWQPVRRYTGFTVRIEPDTAADSEQE